MQGGLRWGALACAAGEMKAKVLNRQKFSARIGLPPGFGQNPNE